MTASKEEIELGVCEIVKECTNYPEKVNAQAHLGDDLGMDSLEVAEVIDPICEKFPKFGQHFYRATGNEQNKMADGWSTVADIIKSVQDVLHPPAVGEATAKQGERKAKTGKRGRE